MLLAVAALSAAAYAQDGPFPCRVQVIRSGDYYYPLFTRIDDSPGGISVYYRVHFRSGRPSPVARYATIGTGSSSARGVEGFNEYFDVEVISWSRFNLPADYGNGSSSSSSSSGGGGFDREPLPEWYDDSYLSVATGYGPSYGGNWGAKVVARMVFLGVSAGYGVSPIKMMPNTYSVGGQLYFWDLYLDFQYSGKHQYYGNHFACTLGTNDIYLFNHKSPCYLNLASGIMGPYDLDPTFAFEVGIGFKIFRSGY
jgi:hypothetical protein